MFPVVFCVLLSASIPLLSAKANSCLSPAVCFFCRLCHRETASPAKGGGSQYHRLRVFWPEEGRSSLRGLWLTGASLQLTELENKTKLNTENRTDRR
jgi:hypothetical protein